MKKITSIVLAFSILLSTIGASVAVSYCPMKKSFSFSLVKDEASCCCKSSKSKGCCKSQKIKLKKIEDNYIVSEFKIKDHQPDFLIFQYPVIFTNASAIAKETKFFVDYSPPEPRGSLSILFRSILI